MHAECRRIYTNRINVDQALKKLILEAYDNIYTSQLEDYLLQYANRSALEILVHLKQTYGFINPTQLAENYNNMTAPINFQDRIEILFKQIEDGVRYANAGAQTYMEAQYVNIDFLLILKTNEPNLGRLPQIICSGPEETTNYLKQRQRSRLSHSKCGRAL
jgi:hypothetical protein